MVTTFTATPGIDVISTTVPIPTLGSLAVNAFVVHGEEPLLVDTGTVVDRSEFLTALETVIDPSTLRWIWLTHTDFDHIGALASLLATNPELRVVTSFVGVGIMGLTTDPLPMDRVHLINPGQSVTIGDRRLTAFRPPVFDNPITTGFVDESSRTLFSSDCFGALLADIPASAAEIDARELRDGQVRWTTIDSPWVHAVDPDAHRANLERLRSTAPDLVLSSHLPPAPGVMIDALVDALAAAPAADRFVGPDQVMLEAMLAQSP
jgi:ODP family beta lactamase